MEAGADPNARDAAGNSALDVLDLSAAALSDAAAHLSSPDGEGSGSGGAEACSSTVVSSNGREQDWNGAREALEGRGGRRKLGESEGARGDDGGPGSDGGDRGARVPPPPIASASEESAGAETGVGVEGSKEVLAELATCCSLKAPGRPSEVGAAAAPAPASSNGRLAGGTPPSDHGSRSAGIPCGECLLPTMVMVRSSCCGGLLCKPCVWKICARRHSCRRCRESK